MSVWRGGQGRGSRWPTAGPGPRCGPSVCPHGAGGWHAGQRSWDTAGMSQERAGVLRGRRLMTRPVGERAGPGRAPQRWASWSAVFLRPEIRSTPRSEGAANGEGTAQLPRRSRSWGGGLPQQSPLLPGSSQPSSLPVPREHEFTSAVGQRPRRKHEKLQQGGHPP